MIMLVWDHGRFSKEKYESGRDMRYQRSGRNRRKDHSGSISTRRLVPDVRWSYTAGEDRAMEGTAMPHYPVVGTDLRNTWTFFIRDSGFVCRCAGCSPEGDRANDTW